MRIAVFDVAAEHSGALTVLREFYREAYGSHSDVQWVFVVSTAELPKLDGSAAPCLVYRFPWVKRTWLHRLYFERFVARRLVDAIDPDLVFSMQNICVAAGGRKQVVYLHQPIPFSDISFSALREPILWIYKHILSHSIYRSIERADKVVVQTMWMRDAAVSRTRVSPSKFAVIPPSIGKSALPAYQDAPEARRQFFYPVSLTPYKNHRVVLDAARILLERGVCDFEVVFTGTEQAMRSMGLSTDGIPVRFCGSMAHDAVLDFMARSVLVFPSLLETYGLPMLEARTIGTFVIASDLPFSREVLGNYPNAVLFDPRNARELAGIMQSIVRDEIEYCRPSESGDDVVRSSDRSTWSDVIDVLRSV